MAARCCEALLTAAGRHPPAGVPRRSTVADALAPASASCNRLTTPLPTPLQHGRISARAEQARCPGPVEHPQRIRPRERRAEAGRRQRVAQQHREGDRAEDRHQARHLRQHRAGGVEELGQEGDVEGEALGMEHVDEEGAQHDPAGAAADRFGGVERRIRSAPELKAEVEQVGRAEPFEDEEQAGRSGEHGAEAEEAEAHGGEVAEADAEDAQQRGAQTVGEGVGADQQHGRAGDEDDGERRGGEGKQDIDGHERSPEAWRAAPGC